MIRDYDNSPSQQIRYAPEQNRKIIIVEGNRNGVISSCVLFEKHDANNNFDTKEDTRLIMMKKAMNPSAIYTNTDNVALSSNIMNKIDMTPLVYTVIDNSEQESLTITFKGVENFSKPLQLFDAQTQISIDIEEDLTLTLPELENNAARYFIKYAPEQTSGFDNIFEETDIKIFQPAQGEVVVTASNTINQIDVFAINGSLIQQRNDINNAWQSFNLPMGAYLFVVKTETGLHRQKVLVK